MRENTLQKKCIAHLKKLGIYYNNNHGDSWGSRGTPDITACIKGRYVAFELKVGDNQLQPAQLLHKKRIEANGGLHFQIRTLEEFISTVGRLLRGEKRGD